MTPEQADIIRDRIRRMKLTYEQACAEIDSEALSGALEDAQQELREHNQGGFNATDSGEREG
jgi:hypothetical protein